MKKLIILFILILTTGCTNYIELNEISIVKILQIDYKDNNYYLKATIIKDNENNYEEIKGKGKTLDKAFDNTLENHSKRLYLSHTELLILTENTVNNKLQDVIDYFIKNTESRNNFDIALSYKEINNNDIYELITSVEEETSTTKTINFETFVKNIYKSKKSYLPIIEDNNLVKGIYLLNNNKISYKLDDKETVIYNLVNNNINKAIINDISIESNNTYKLNINDTTYLYIKSIIDNNKDYEKIIKKKINKLNNKYKDYNIFEFKDDIKITVKGETSDE